MTFYQPLNSIVIGQFFECQVYRKDLEKEVLEFLQVKEERQLVVILVTSIDHQNDHQLKVTGIVCTNFSNQECELVFSVEQGNLFRTPTLGRPADYKQKEQFFESQNRWEHPELVLQTLKRKKPPDRSIRFKDLVDKERNQKEDQEKEPKEPEEAKTPSNKIEEPKKEEIEEKEKNAQERNEKEENSGSSGTEDKINKPDSEKNKNPFGKENENKSFTLSNLKSF